MKLNYYTTEPTNIHCNISDYSSKVEILEKIKELFDNSNENDEFNFVLKPHINTNLSIPDVIKVLQNYKQQNITVNIFVASEAVIEKLSNYFSSEVRMREEIYLGKENDLLVEIKTGDITEEFCDAIVNASNTLLKLGSGVSGAIRNKAGESFQEEMYQIAERKRLDNGDAVITGSHALRTCKYIIHAATVEGSEETVRMAIQNSLEICNDKQIKSVAFPALATGVGGMSKSLFARIFIEEVKRFADNENDSLTRITLVLWSSSDFEEIGGVIKNYLSAE